MTVGDKGQIVIPAKARKEFDIGAGDQLVVLGDDTQGIYQKQEISMALADNIYDKPVIETNRLIIRPMRVSDVPALKKWMPDRSIYAYWGKGPSKAEKNPELLFEKNGTAVKKLSSGHRR